MGNYCCRQKDQDSKPNFVKKISVSSTSSSRSKLNSMDSMKKQSFKLLNFLQKQTEGSDFNIKENIKEVQVISELGKGGQARVFEIVIKKIVSIQQQNSYQEEKIAIKRINLKKQGDNMDALSLSQKLLSQNECPFIVDGIFTFSCQKYQYSGMPVAQGGDLTSFLQKWRGKGDSFRKLGQEGVKLVLAGIVIGLEYLHSKNIIYCDLKTDNILIDEKGFPLLTDFQLITDKQKIPADQFQGTLTSVGPEIHFSQYIDKGIDLWALGVLIYFITYNETPFSLQMIKSEQFVEHCKQRQNSYQTSYKKVSNQLKNLINSLLKVDPKQRLGYCNIQQIKNHQFFNNLDWQSYYRKQIPNPIAQIVQKYPIKSTARNRRKQTLLLDRGDKGKIRIRPRKYSI